jgi:hypothetical protein
MAGWRWNETAGEMVLAKLAKGRISGQEKGIVRTGLFFNSPGQQPYTFISGSRARRALQ